MFDLYGGRERMVQALKGERGAFYCRPDFDVIRALLTSRRGGLSPEANPSHPYFQRPNPFTLVYEEIEALWAPVAERDDWSGFYRKLGEIETVREAYGLSD
jgi:hypothetical protein